MNVTNDVNVFFEEHASKNVLDEEEEFNQDNICNIINSTYSVSDATPNVCGSTSNNMIVVYKQPFEFK